MRLNENLIVEALDRLTRAVEGLDARLAKVEDRLTRLTGPSEETLEERLSNIEQMLAYHQDKWLDHDKEIWRLKRKA